MGKVRVLLTHLENNKFKAEIGERVDNALLLGAIGAQMNKDWQLARELQEFHVLYCPCHQSRSVSADCSFFGGLRPDRFATFVWAADGAVVTFKKARHASDLMKLITEIDPINPIIRNWFFETSIELPGDTSDCEEDDDCPVPPPPCQFVAATLVSAVASESGDEVVLTVAALSGGILHVTLSADASVGDAAAVILAEWSLGDNTEVRILTMDGDAPLGNEVLMSELGRDNVGGLCAPFSTQGYPARPPMARSTKFSVTFKPGFKIGMFMNEVGEVTKVDKDGLAAKRGVQVGMSIRTIDEQAYSKSLMRTKCTGTQDFEVFFAR